MIKITGQNVVQIECYANLYKACPISESFIDYTTIFYLTYIHLCRCYKRCEDDQT